MHTAVPSAAPSAHARFSFVLEHAAAEPAAAARHFLARLAVETDPSDVHLDLERGSDAITVIDTRSADAYAQCHVPGAISIPHGKLIASRLAEYPPDTLFVVYCAGPHCNGAARGALRLAKLGRPVKLMVGGITGWLDEGFTLERAEAAA